MQIDSRGTQIHRRHGRRRAAGIQPGGIVAFPGVIVEVELHRHAVGDSLIGQPASGIAQRPDVIALNRKSHAVCRGIQQLEGEVGYEALHRNLRCKPGGSLFVGSSVSQLQHSAGHGRAIVQRQGAGRESATRIVDVGNAWRADRVGRCGYRAAGVACLHGDGLQGLRRAHRNRAAVYGGRGCGSAPVGCVVNDSPGCRVADRHRLRRAVSPGRQRKRWRWQLSGNGIRAACNRTVVVACLRRHGLYGLARADGDCRAIDVGRACRRRPVGCVMDGGSGSGIADGHRLRCRISAWGRR